MNSDLQRERFCNANYGSFNVLRIFDISNIATNYSRTKEVT